MGFTPCTSVDSLISTPPDYKKALGVTHQLASVTSNISLAMSSIVRLVFSMVAEVCSVMEKDKERRSKLCRGLRFIKDEMGLVIALMKDMDKECRGAVQEIRIQQLQEFAYDVEDFVETLRDPAALSKLLVAIKMDPRTEQLEIIKQFKDTISSLAQDLKQSPESNQGQDADQGATSDTDEDAEEQLQSIDGSKSKIVELLEPSPGEGQQLRVISIVGCRGVGKTALARAVHKKYSSSNEFDCVAWVVASGCNKKDLLDKILESVREDLERRARDTENPPNEAEGASTTKPNLQDILSRKRCLVFVDDVQKVEVWKDTVDACPKNGSTSRMVVTTSVHSVATACSSGSYVYRMQCLSDGDSKTFFWRKVYGCQKDPPYSLVTDSESIFSKCDGLPRALTSVAKHLNMKGDTLRGAHCIEVGQNLGKDYLSGNNNAESVFKEMRRSLMHCYDSLPDYDHRSCMLYLGIFPKGHQIKSKSLMRRLMAEGLVANEGFSKCFDVLVDRCIVEPVQICNNSVVAKRCQVHGLVLEYIVQKSVAKNVVTLIQGREPLLKGSTEARVRRLSIQYSTGERFDELDEDKAALRSLTMFQNDPQHCFKADLKMCTMLRILDLEGCRHGLDQEFLDGLSELLLLKYLNLRNTLIDKLPTKIKKLKRLETLDIRETKVKILPMEVIMLPKLAYLFGKFQLPEVPEEEADKLYEFLKKKSALHTLAGFITNKRQSPEHVILLARNLKKVKVWLFPHPELASSNATAPDRPSKRKSNWCPPRSVKTCLVSLDHERPWNKTEERRSNDMDFIKLLTRVRAPSVLEYVSITSRASTICSEFLGSLEGPCTISSIKLRGIMNRLPDSNKLRELGRIKKLQLFSTGLNVKDLSALQNLRGLEYLKLVEHDDRLFCNGVFIVEKNGFESLKSLCIDAPKVPKMQFKEGSMKSLTSLYLFCPNSQSPSGIVEGISHLAYLSEVILHSSMQRAWEAMANGHPNRPCVKRQQPEPTANTQQRM